MQLSKCLSLSWLIVLLMLGCGSRVDHPPKDSGKWDEDIPIHEPRSSGTVFDFGEYHAEFRIDHANWECTVEFLNGDGRHAKPLPVSVTVLTLVTQETKTTTGKPVAAMRVLLYPKSDKDGKASRFVGRDPGFSNGVYFAGMVTGEVNGRQIQGAFKE
jgi:hypothetical protein